MGDFRGGRGARPEVLDGLEWVARISVTYVSTREALTVLADDMERGAVSTSHVIASLRRLAAEMAAVMDVAQSQARATP